MGLPWKRTAITAATGGACRPFSPLNVSGLKLWLDASAITGLNNNDSVTTWTDLSGQGNNATQATGSRKPTYKTAILNSLPVVRFDGVDDYLANASLVLAQPATIFVVVQQSGGSIDYRILYDGTTSTTVMALTYVVSTTKWSAYGGTAFVGQSGTTGSNVPKCVSSIYNGASTEIRINGGTAATGNGGSQGWTGGFTLGDGWQRTGRYATTADIGEILAYNSALSASNRAAVENYLIAKWAV